MSTAAYHTALPHAAPREAAWQDSWQNAPHPGHLDPQEGVPGYFAPRIYRGRNLDELIPAIVAELGEDAVVIRHHRGLTGGFAGFFQKSFVEIEARRGDPGGQLLDRYDEDDAAPALPGDPAPAPGDTAPALGYAAPALPAETARAQQREFDDSPAPIAPKPLNWDGPTEVWATNPFAAALAEAEAAVRAAEPAVPPDLDAALAETLAEAENAEAPEEIGPVPADLFAESPALPVAIDDAKAEAQEPEAATEDPEAATEDPEAATAAAEAADAPNPASIAALAQLLAEVASDRVVLALPATLGATPVAQLLQALRPLGANALAIIHADETDQLGVAVQAACAFESTPVYVLARADCSGANGGPRAWALSSIDPCRLLDGPLPPR